MDLQLPGIDGMEALRQIRGSDGGGAVPVVAVTASAMEEDRDRAYAAGFDGYVQKPISVRGLQQQVHDFLNPERERDMTGETSAQATVLVVDDQPQNIRLLDAILSPRGYDVQDRRLR